MITDWEVPFLSTLTQFCEDVLAAVTLLLLFSLVLGCHFPFHGPRVPDISGDFLGIAEVVTAMDEDGHLHDVIQLRISEPSPRQHATPLLVDDRHRLRSAADFPSTGRVIRVAGTLTVDRNPFLPHGRLRAHRASDAAVVAHDDGSETRFYTDGSEHLLVVESFIEER